jgi:transposase InsO family protein
MAKYSYEFKKQVVEAYLSGEGGYEYLAKRYGVPAWSNIKKWVRNYETHGDKGLMRSRKQDKYSFEKKLSVVELYMTTEVSYQQLALQENILNPFMDMYNSEIISYSISRNPSSQAIVSALTQAIEVTNDCKYRRTFHSDRGWAYQMKVYNKMLTKNKIFRSMSRKGNYYDNSVMENFFGVLKQEMYYGVVYYSYDELKNTIGKYITYYNKYRIKSKLNWMSPVEYRLSFVA